MKNFILRMIKRVNQKMLLKQIMEFLDDPKFCNSNKKDAKDWLIELSYCTNAKEVKGITYNDLLKFYDQVRKKESSLHFQIEAAKTVRKFYRKGIAEGWAKHFPTEDSKIDRKKGQAEFINKITKGWRRGPMPDAHMVKEVRSLYGKRKEDGTTISFRDIVKILEEKYHRKFYLPTVHQWYHSKSV